MKKVFSKTIMAAFMTTLLVGCVICPMAAKAVAKYDTYGTGEFVSLGKFNLMIGDSYDWTSSDYDLEEDMKYIEVDLNITDFGTGEKKLIDPKRFVIISAKDIEGNELIDEDEKIEPYLDMPEKEFAEYDYPYYNEAADYESGEYIINMMLFQVPKDTAEITVALYKDDKHKGEPECAFEVSINESDMNFESFETTEEE